MSDPETPEADALEQAHPLDGPAEPVRPAPAVSRDPDVPEADAFEQALEVPMDEDDAPR